jgi:hypothetical protein
MLKQALFDTILQALDHKNAMDHVVYPWFFYQRLMPKVALVRWYILLILSIYGLCISGKMQNLWWYISAKSSSLL